jgi:hypothetical protein
MERVFFMTTQEINLGLEIIKLDGMVFYDAVAQKSYTVNGHGFYHKDFGYLGFKENNKPYVPVGGKKACKEILKAGGFTTYEGMEWHCVITKNLRLDKVLACLKNPKTAYAELTAQEKREYPAAVADFNKYVKGFKEEIETCLNEFNGGSREKAFNMLFALYTKDSTVLMLFILRNNRYYDGDGRYSKVSKQWLKDKMESCIDVTMFDIYRCDHPTIWNRLIERFIVLENEQINKAV